MISIVAVINIACEPSYIMKNSATSNHAVICNITTTTTKTIRTRFTVSPLLDWDFLCSAELFLTSHHCVRMCGNKLRTGVYYHYSFCNLTDNVFN